MAYTAAQRKQHIYELQTYLHAIALMDSSIPLVIPDGFYGNENILATQNTMHSDIVTAIASERLCQ